MRDLRCVIGMHADHPTTNDSGDRYLVCARCGKETYPTGIAGGGIVPY